jgi:hypothetical protein
MKKAILLFLILSLCLIKASCDCTPTEGYLAETYGTCQSGLTKEVRYYIQWPDGFTVNNKIVFGAGSCGANYTCCVDGKPIPCRKEKPSSMSRHLIPSILR